MNSYWRALVCTALLTVTCPDYSYCSESHFAIEMNSTTHITSKLVDKNVNISIRTTTIESGSACVFPANLPPEIKSVTVIQDIDIYIDGKRLPFIPYSVFSNFVDPRSASIEYDNDRYILVIRGGDGAETYFAKVYFDANHIFSKKIYSSLMPDDVAEDTRYYFGVLKDE